MIAFHATLSSYRKSTVLEHQVSVAFVRKTSMTTMYKPTLNKVLRPYSRKGK